MITFHPLTRVAARAAAAGALVVLAGAASAQVAVVVHPGHAASRAEASDVANLFLGKTGSLHGERAVPVDQAENTAVRDAMYAKVAGMSPTQVKTAWARMAFSGRGTPPRALSGSDEVKRFVAGNPNAIGYIEPSAVDGSVKVLLTLD